MRTADLDGARQDYDAALPIYREIHDRLGEANCHQGLGNLQLAKGSLDTASNEFRASLDIHVAIQDQLGMGADLGYMARAAAAAGQDAKAALLYDESLRVFRRIGERWGQALSLRSQGEAFLKLGAQQAALAAWWQARELFSAIKDRPSAARLDAQFAQLEKDKEATAYSKLIEDLMRQAGEWRQEAVMALRQAVTKPE